MNTLDTIHKLANERLGLWLKAGNSGLKTDETRRVQVITDELANLWDTHRREVASGHRVPNTDSRQTNRAA